MFPFCAQCARPVRVSVSLFAILPSGVTPPVAMSMANTLAALSMATRRFPGAPAAEKEGKFVVSAVHARTCEKRVEFAPVERSMRMRSHEVTSPGAWYNPTKAPLTARVHAGKNANKTARSMALTQLLTYLGNLS